MSSSPILDDIGLSWADQRIKRIIAIPFFRLLHLALAAACLAALPFCHAPTESDNHTPPDPIDLSNLQVGQSSTYISFAL
ncbi:MAG: hypothetical protein JSU61_04580, partial [Fidelibacterota bacterium]